MLKDKKCRWERADDFIAGLRKLDRDDDPHVSENTYELSHYGVQISDGVGDASFERDVDDHHIFNWSLRLGPVNSKRLLDFVLALPDEPEDDEQKFPGSDPI